MARSLIDIKVDVSQIEALRDRLSEISPETLGASLVDTLNTVANDTYDLARTMIVSGVNLDDQYVRSRMSVREASAKKPTAEIVATGDRKMMTGLGHYGALQLTQGTRWTTEDGVAQGWKIGPWPKWEPRTGDTGRGLGAGSKQDGISVEVKRGNRKPMHGIFSIPGKVHSDGSPVLFRGTKRPGNGVMDRNRKQSRQGVEALQGPSVYQLFRFAANKLADEVTDNLQEAIADAAEREIQKALK